jgi:MarR family 2-MHQ and catechol resistance regulon transcriptional repressor
MSSSLSADRALDRDAALLHRAVSDLVRVYQFRDRNQICCHDISVTQCYALSAMLRLGPLRLDALARELYLDKSSASRLVDQLEIKGYLVRGADRDDGRAISLEITEAGRGLYARIEAGLVEQQKHLVADFAPEVRRAASELIVTLARAAEKRFAGRGDTCRDNEDPICSRNRDS